MTEKNFVLNVKTKAGTIFTVRADSPEELITNIKQSVSSDVASYIGGLEEALLGATPAPVSPAVAAITAIGGTVISETPIAPPAPAPAFAPVPPPAYAPAPTAGKQCVHGEMIKRTGNGAKGEWRGFFCPTPKGTADQCNPSFAQRNSPEWASF